MLPRRDEPFPIEAARDLPGVVRCIYADAKGRNAGARVLARIERACRLLDEAIGPAAAHPPGSVGHAAAWRKGEDRACLACELVDALSPAERIVEAARARVRTV